MQRRTLLKMAGLSGLSWLTPLGTALARHAEHNPVTRPLSLIVLWLEGAPSQLETVSYTHLTLPTIYSV